MKPEQLLELARALNPDAGYVLFDDDNHDSPTYGIVYSTLLDNDIDCITITDDCMYPLWRKYADDYYKLRHEYRLATSAHANPVMFALEDCFEASKSPEGIAEALYQMMVDKG